MNDVAHSSGHSAVTSTPQALCEWGLSGIDALLRQVAVLVIVDVLSFSTAVDVAVSRGAIVYPLSFSDAKAAEAAAIQKGAVLATRRGGYGQFSLSPASLTKIVPGTKLMLPSLNGSRLSFAASERLTRVTIMAGCLRNASAVAAAARSAAGERPIAVIPAGETWPDRSLRPSIEDWLGAGAILERLGGPCSPEAAVARSAYRSSGEELASLIRLSVSGRELSEAGFAGDVDLALEEDASKAVPILSEGAFRCA